MYLLLSIVPSWDSYIFSTSATTVILWQIAANCQWLFFNFCFYLVLITFIFYLFPTLRLFLSILNIHLSTFVTLPLTYRPTTSSLFHFHWVSVNIFWHHFCFFPSIYLSRQDTHSSLSKSFLFLYLNYILCLWPQSKRKHLIFVFPTQAKFIFVLILLENITFVIEAILSIFWKLRIVFKASCLRKVIIKVSAWITKVRLQVI